MRFVFVVDTDSYSGNFERELCGYVTGRWDNETHGGDQATIAQKELLPEIWEYLQNHVISCMEEHDDIPYSTPVVIWPTAGWFNDGMGGHFKEGQEKEAFEHHIKEVAAYEKQHNTKLHVSKGLTKFPAYQSVGIFFDEKPPQHIVDVLKERAYKFTKEYWPKHKIFGHKIDVTGFRLVREATVKNEESL